MSKPLYYQNCLLTEEDFSELSQRFEIPYELVAEAVSQIRENGHPTTSSYIGVARVRIEKMAEAIKFEAEEENHDPLPKSEQADIIDNAAIALMQAMSSTESGSFIITEDGVCKVNPNSPPTLEQSYEVVGKVIKLRELAPKMDDKTSWMLGSIIDELETLHGENFEVGQVCEATEKSANTILTTVSVYRAFKKKRYNLSFSCHKEAFHQKIPAKSKDLILHKAELYGLGPKPIRHLACIVKAMGDDQVIKNIRSKNQADDLIQAHKSNKVQYIVYDGGIWTRISGTAAEIPKGQVVLDLKNWTARANNGAPVDITKSKA